MGCVLRLQINVSVSRECREQGKQSIETDAWRKQEDGEVERFLHIPQQYPENVDNHQSLFIECNMYNSQNFIVIKTV